MPRVDFLISNPGHHLEMALPVATSLARGRGWSCRVLSLCELRGFASPTERVESAGVRQRKVVGARLRRSPSMGRTADPASGTGSSRRVLRQLVWSLWLRPSLARLLSDAPDVCVLPNDAAYPYDRIARLLCSRGIPFLLMQEGVRFPLPGTPEGRAYGQGGATAIAAWGEASAGYFRQVGAPPESIHLTGSPRFDTWPAASPDAPTSARSSTGASDGAKTILLVTNPIDDQGYCSTPEKLALFRRFVTGLEEDLTAGTLRLVVKLHGRESTGDYSAAVADLAAAPLVRVVENQPLPSLFALADAVVIWSSTVGLEALLCSLPLGVAEIPGLGFAYDYVSSGAALPISDERPVSEQVHRLLAADESRRQAASDLLRRNFAVTGAATEAVTDLIRRILETS